MTQLLVEIQKMEKIEGIPFWDYFNLFKNNFLFGWEIFLFGIMKIINIIQFY